MHLLLLSACEGDGDGFFCYLSGECVDIEQRCDEIADCPDHEDERFCGKLKSKFNYSGKLSQSYSLISVY